MQPLQATELELFLELVHLAPSPWLYGYQDKLWPVQAGILSMCLGCEAKFRREHVRSDK
jgi:hypothetical protein